MKRIKNADINFKVNPKRINLNDFSIKFYTVNSEAYFFTKDQNNLVSVERDATIYDEDVIISGGTKVLDYYLPLDWSELVQLGEGVLNYRCINNIEDPFFPDMTYNKVVEDTTAYYIDSDIIVDPSINRNIIERVTELESGLAVESIDREEADTFISGAVDTEVARAISAETELSERIDELASGTSEALDDEIARAEAAEAAIRQDLTDESEIRSSADTAIWTSVNAEITRSTSADTALDNKIEVETLRAIGVENSISGNLETYKATNNAALQAETTRATSAETNLGNAIEDEVTARENADSSLTARIDNLEASFLEEIDAEEARAKEAESGITIALNNEVSRATNAETIIANSLNSEITRATSAETSLNNQIDAEVLRATAAEASLEAKIGLVSGATELINAETARAVTAENALSGAIDSVSAATSGSVEQLDAKIDQEIADRTADVDAEETRAKGVENALSGAIDSLDVRFFDDAKYEDSGNTKVINFYNGNVVKATIDCTDFLVDGMIDDVRIENGYLVIDFNTASGKQDIRIPLTDIFNPANYYTKSETSGKTEIANALAQKLSISDFNAYSGTVDTLINSKASQSDLDTLNGVVTEHIADTTVHVTASDKTKWNKVDEKADTTAVTAAIDAAVSGKANSSDVYLKSETSGKTEIANALAQKVNINDFSTYSAATNSRLAEDEEVTAAAFNELNEALSGKVDTSTYNTYTAATATALANKQNTLVAGENITISGNVISATAEGGGKTISGGTNISVTTGETADTINCTLPISAISNNIYSTNNNPFGGNIIKLKNIVLGYDNTISRIAASNLAYCNFINGRNNSIGSGGYKSSDLSYNTIFGEGNTINDNAHKYAVAFGNYNTINNPSEFASGKYNVSNTGSTSADKTLFSVGNGTSTSARHNAFEVRQNGDIYITKDGQDVKLQDQLGGGGDLTNYYTKSETNTLLNGKVSISDFNTYSAATDSRLAEDEEVTAAALVSLNESLSGKQDTLIAGTNITISGNVISAQGGGSTYTAGDGISITNNVISVTGKTNQSDFTGHTTNTSIHVTTAQTAAWDAKSDFSGSYNDLTDKPTIPTVPTSNTAFTNDAGYITANDITGKTDVTAFTAHTGDTTIHVTSSDKTSWNGAVTALGGLKLVKLTQSQYDALVNKDNSTLYVIVG